MSLTDYVYIFIAFLVTNYFVIKSYQVLCNKKKKLLEVKTIIVILLSVAISMINNLYNLTMYRCLVFILIWYLQNLIIFKEDYKACLFKTLFIYSLQCVIELSLSIFLISLPYLNFQEIFKQKFLSMLISFAFIILTYLAIYFLFKIKKVKNVFKTNNNESLINFLIIVFSAFIILLNNKNVMLYNASNYMINILLIILLIIIFIVIIVQTIKINRAHAKSNLFLDFLNIYEKKIDVDREFKHEVFNYFLIIKSLKNKKDVDNYVNELLLKYNSKTKTNYKNICLLPTGIKGIIYYKVFEIENIKGKVELNISSKVEKLFAKKETKEYKEIGEILTILLDNCRDAIKTLKNKNITIDMYLDKEIIVIEISNPMNKQKINFKKIEKLGYSTKGKKRGMGLYIARKIVNSNKNFDLNFYVKNQRFYSKFKIK